MDFSNTVIQGTATGSCPRMSSTCKTKKFRIQFLLVILLLGFCLTSCKKQDVPEALPKSLMTSSLFNLFFLDDTRGWAVGKLGKIVATSNGGERWESQKSGTDNALRGIFFADQKGGWVVGDAGTLIHTRDGGRSWTAQHSRTKKHLRDVFFINELTGWVVGEQGTVLSTVTGGKEWKVRDDVQKFFTRNDNPFLISLFACCFMDDETGWIAGDYGTIIHTRDGGATWEEQTSGTDALLMDITFVTPLTGWAVGENGTVLSTRDGGLTWQTQASNTTYLLNGISCADPLHCWAVGYGTILGTTDGGSNWNIVRGDKKMWLYGIDAVGTDKISITGDFGELLISSDGGTSWVTRIPYE